MTAPPIIDRSARRAERLAVIRHRAAAAQLNPSATTLTTLYTVPVKYQAKGRVHVCNRSATATTFRISIGLAGAADDNKQYLAYDAVIAGNEDAQTVEFVADEKDVIRVYATLATLSFSFLGTEEPLP